MIPMNTPVSAGIEPGAYPACATASWTTSRLIRCCGSIAAASRSLIPKNAASNRNAESTNAPQAAARSASLTPPPTGQRSAGTGPIASTPASNASKNASGPSPPPGNRHPIPTIAIASPAPSSSATRALRVRTVCNDRCSNAS